jgi:Ca2+-binding EF-hand superfamily protein
MFQRKVLAAIVVASFLLCLLPMTESAAINRTVHIAGPKGDMGLMPQYPILPHALGQNDRDHPEVLQKGQAFGPPAAADALPRQHPESNNLHFVAGGAHDIRGFEVRGDSQPKADNVHAPPSQLPPLGAAHGLGNVGFVTEKVNQNAKHVANIEADVPKSVAPPQVLVNPHVLPRQPMQDNEENVELKVDGLQVQENPHIDPQQHESRKPAPPHIVPMKLEEVQPPDHIDGLRVEQDGHLNRDYKKEILIGNHDEFENGGEKRLLSRLKIVFMRADVDHDAFLTHAELKAWIMFKVQQHLDEALAENERIFHHLDTDSDGFVTWKEFHIHFLLAKGHSENDTLKHVEDYDSLNIEAEERERLIRYKFRWAEADEEPQDNQLTIKEMQNFRHPEQSSKMIVRMAKDIIDNLDHDEDGMITEEEFVALPPGDIDDMMHERSTDEMWRKERLKEFQNVIDLNHDGRVDIEELKIYVDPHNENHAHLEADNLIQLADENSDGKLSMSEVLDNAELFLGSKMVDTGRNFHDEF